MPRAWDIGYTQPCIKCQEKSATHVVYFWSCKTLPYTQLETFSYIPQQGQSLHIWTTSQSTTGCYKNKYTIQFLWMACISQFATAILSGETELALGTMRVNHLISSPWERGKALDMCTAILFLLSSNQYFLIFIITAFCPRAGLSLQTQAPSKFCPKAGLPLQTQEPRFQFLLGMNRCSSFPLLSAPHLNKP